MAWRICHLQDILEEEEQRVNKETQSVNLCKSMTDITKDNKAENVVENYDFQRPEGAIQIKEV